MRNPPYDPPRIAPIDAADLITGVVRAKRPFSLVRLGDGELALLGIGQESPREHTERSLGYWFGPQHAPWTAFRGFAEELRDAVRNADLVGIPRVSRQLAEEYASYVVPIFERNRLRSARSLYTDVAIHTWFQHLRALDEWLRDAEFVGLITCRDVAARVAQVFGVRRTALHRIPPDFITTGAAASPPHYPDVYERLRREIAPPFQGALYLVGAGAFGKVYCDWVRARGGIAIDIGSIFDGWAGVHVRPRIRRRQEQYSLERYQARLGRAERLAEYRETMRRNVGGVLPRDELEFLLSEGARAPG